MLWGERFGEFAPADLGSVPGKFTCTHSCNETFAKSIVEATATVSVCVEVPSDWDSLMLPACSTRNIICWGPESTCPRPRQNCFVTQSVSFTASHRTAYRHPGPVGKKTSAKEMGYSSCLRYHLYGGLTTEKRAQRHTWI